MSKYIIIALTALALVACDKEPELLVGTDHHHDEHHDHEHEAAEEGELIPVGFLNGSWRVATLEDDTPVGYLDFVHDLGQPTATGHYMMAIGIYERLDGQTGDLKEANLSDADLQVRWNPTDDAEEFFTLSARRVDNDRLEGTITAERNTELNVEVEVTRRVFD